MSTPGPRPPPPPPPDPAELALANVLSLALRGDGPDARYALEHALASAKRKGIAWLDRYRDWGRPVSRDEWARRFLEAAQVARDELDRLTRAVAEAVEAAPIAGCGPAGLP
jgi:hypothetical protein